MSLLSPEALLLQVFPDHIAVLRHCARTGAVREFSQRTNDQPGNMETLAALVVDTAAAYPGAVARILLADALVRYFVLPWREDVWQKEEEVALATLAFDDVHGAGSHAEWVMAYSAEAAGQARLVAAVPAALLHPALEGLRAAGHRVKSVHTRLSAVIRAAERAYPDVQHFLSQEPGRVTTAVRGAQGWERVRSARAEDDFAAVVRRWQQDAALAGELSMSEGKTQLIAVGSHRLVAIDSLQGAGIQLLPCALDPAWQRRLDVAIESGVVAEALRYALSDALLGVAR